MTLEEYIAHLNSLAFWREFTFAQNKFSPRAGSELELADNLIWFGDRAYILQLKQRDQPTMDAKAERNWFNKKVIKKATSQIRDSLRYLEEHTQIRITNEHGHSFEIERKNLETITKIVIFLAAPNLPEDCWQICLRAALGVAGDKKAFHQVARNHQAKEICLALPFDVSRERLHLHDRAVSP